MTTEVPPLGPEDEDVARERERVINGRAHSDILTMINLSKVLTSGNFLICCVDAVVAEWPPMCVHPTVSLFLTKLFKRLMNN